MPGIHGQFGGRPGSLARINKKKTAQQQINYNVAVRKLQVDMEDFVKAVEQNGYKVRAIAWNYRPIYWANSHKRHWTVSLFGEPRE